MTRQSTFRSECPLRGVSVLVTRPREDAERLLVLLEALGARVYCLPTISIRPTTATPPVADALGRLADFDWIVFTSRNAVRAVFDWLETHRRLPMPRLKVAAVGAGTAGQIRLRGIEPDCIPAEHGAAGLAVALHAAGVCGAQVLLPLSDLAGNDLQEALESAGARVTAIPVYATAPAQPADTVAVEALVQGKIEVVAFASPSAFRNLVALPVAGVSEALRRAYLAVIGPTTAAAVRAAGYEPSAVAGRPTTEGLVEAIVTVCETEHL